MSEYTDETFENHDNSETAVSEPTVSSEESTFSVTPDGGYYTHVSASQDAETDTEPPVINETADTGYTAVPQFKKPEKSERRYSFATIVTSIVIAAVIGALSGIASVNVLLDKKSGSTATEPPLNETPATNVTINVDEPASSVIEAVAAKVTPSVVGIRTTAAVISFFGGSTESTEEGSGIVYSSNGYIITNYHVIESAVVSSSNSNIEVYLGNDKSVPYNATVVGYNISNDIAVIKIDKTGLPAVEFADTSSLKVGQYVAAIGNPGGLEYMGSVTYGVISGLNRAVTSSSDEAVSLIQTDAAINPGNSGGALVNTEGKLIGVNSSKIVSTSFEGMGFAIPADAVKEICEKIISKENDPDPYIGVTFSEEWTSDRLKRYGYPTGAVIKSTVSGGPADKARIQKGDIITEFNNIAINDYEQLNDEIAKCKPGQSVSVKIYRNGRTYSTTIDIGSNNSQ